MGGMRCNESHRVAPPFIAPVGCHSFRARGRDIPDSRRGELARQEGYVKNPKYVRRVAPKTVCSRCDVKWVSCSRERW